jgi:dipeptidyl aminopeptidase/acylaminoacyl peptidase
LLAKPGSWAASDITGDGTRVLVGNYRSISDSSMFELDAKSGNLTDLTPKSGESPTVSVQAIGYMPGETSILYGCDIEGGRPKVFLHDLKTGQVTLLGVDVNEDGYGTPFLYRLPGFEKVAIPAMDKGIASIASIRGNRVVYGMSNARTPGLAFRFDVGADGKSTTAPQQITFADDQGIDLNAFTLPKLIKYKSFDGTEIPAFVFLPAGYKEGTQIPFLINYHGGPEGQSRPGFTAQVQYLLSEGFGVMFPNVRGSTGYGRAFHMMDDYKNRWNSVKDGVDAAEWLVANKYTKPGMISTWGGSYGGYMSVACVVEDQMRVDAGKRAERLFGAGINIVGVVNLKTFLEKTAGYRRKLREVEYGPLSDPEFLASASPMTHIDKIKVPMFIAHDAVGHRAQGQGQPAAGVHRA